MKKAVAQQPKMSFKVLSEEDIREIRHQLVARRKARTAMRAQLRAEREQDNQFRALLREVKEELDGSLGNTADA